MSSEEVVLSSVSFPSVPLKQEAGELQLLIVKQTHRQLWQLPNINCRVVTKVSSTSSHGSVLVPWEHHSLQG